MQNSRTGGGARQFQKHDAIASDGGGQHDVVKNIQRYQAALAELFSFPGSNGNMDAYFLVARECKSALGEALNSDTPN